MLKNLYCKFASILSPAIVPFTVKNMALCLNLDQCNLRCVMCPQTYSREKNRDLYKTTNMSRGELRELLSSKLSQRTTISVVGGGEPFLYPYLDDILLNAPTNQRRLMIMTNGTLLHTHPVFWEVAQKAPITLMFSIDAAIADTYESIRVQAKWSVLMENIERYVELCQKNPQLRISTSFVVLKKNVHELMDFLQLNLKWKANYIHIHPAIPGEFDPELSVDHNDPYFLKTMMDAAKFCSQHHIATDPLDTIVPSNYIDNLSMSAVDPGISLKPSRHDPRRSCTAPRESMTITHDGQVFLCDTAFRVYYSLGNVFLNNLAGI
jgi:MoaA/NifB/PqqE/SkfB family radical SAM enzyme